MIIDFLKTERSKDELKTALDIVRDFKLCESGDEWMMTPFSAWIKLEQLEEFLAHLVDGDELADDTKRFIKAHSS